MVDDEMETVGAIGFALDRTYEVIRKNSVDSALKVLGDGEPLALLMLDVMMPVPPPGDMFRAGVTVATQAWEMRPSLPIFALSNIDDPEVEEFFSSRKYSKLVKKYALRPRNAETEVGRFLESFRPELSLLE